MIATVNVLPVVTGCGFRLDDIRKKKETKEPEVKKKLIEIHPSNVHQ